MFTNETSLFYMQVSQNTAEHSADIADTR